MTYVTYLAKNGRELEESIGGDPFPKKKNCTMFIIGSIYGWRMCS